MSIKQSGAIAHVNFRVRCETLGHGEDIFLIEDGDVKMQKVRIPCDVYRVISLVLYS